MVVLRLMVGAGTFRERARKPQAQEKAHVGPERIRERRRKVNIFTPSAAKHSTTEEDQAPAKPLPAAL